MTFKSPAVGQASAPDHTGELQIQGTREEVKPVRTGVETSSIDVPGLDSVVQVPPNLSFPAALNKNALPRQLYV